LYSWGVQSGKKTETTLKTYKVKEFTYGVVMDNMAANSEFKTISKIEPLQQFPLKLEKDIPALPSMDSWVNIKELGAKGDGITDDTKIFQDAIDKYPVIYVPQGWYHFTQTVKMRPGTKLIGAEAAAVLEVALGGLLVLLPVLFPNKDWTWHGTTSSGAYG
jgi:Pectate lyase superfamily protein